MLEKKPAPLQENAALAFDGEPAWAAAQLMERQAKSLETARNPTGRPNADVMRHLVGVRSGQIETAIQIDFPAHFTEQEARLYEKPFQLLLRKVSPGSRANWWVNPRANPALRNAIARVERYLATPRDGELPAWDWIESENLPLQTLLIVARDDDFTHGILQSRLFSLWWRTWSHQLSPLEIVESFPFPWPPRKLLSALSRVQEECRLAIARAARAGDQERINAEAASAYAISSDASDQEIVTRLKELNQRQVR